MHTRVGHNHVRDEGCIYLAKANWKISKLCLSNKYLNYKVMGLGQMELKKCYQRLGQI